MVEGRRRRSCCSTVVRAQSCRDLPPNSQPAASACMSSETPATLRDARVTRFRLARDCFFAASRRTAASRARTVVRSTNGDLQAILLS